MKMLQIELDSFKVNQEALNESSKERFNFIETEIQSLRRKIEENNRTISTVVQIQSIQNKLETFEERIGCLEALNQSSNTQEQNITKRKQLTEISKKFASVSTVIGMTRIVRARNRYMKTYWVVMTLISLAFGLYLTSGTIKDFLQYDVVTQTKLVDASSSHFPSVTFCFNKPQTQNLTSFFNEALFIRDRKKDDNPNLIGDQYFDGNFGNWDAADCIKFNHFTNKSDSQLVSAASLTGYLVFDIDLSVKFTFIYVFLSDNYNNILDWSQYVTISYNIKGEYDIAYKKEVEHKLEMPYNQCQNVSDITYRQSNCLAMCKNEKFASRHNCTLRNYYSLLIYSFCNEEISGSLEFDSVCKEECPKECTTTKFEILISNPKLQPSSPESLIFLVWPLDLNYIEISQTPKMNGYSLLNEIGGAMGLFVGITFLSLFEFLEFFFEIVLVFLK